MPQYEKLFSSRFFSFFLGFTNLTVKLLWNDIEIIVKLYNYILII